MTNRCGTVGPIGRAPGHPENVKVVYLIAEFRTGSCTGWL